MRIIPVSLALFQRTPNAGELEVWVQRREDDGPYHGLLEFPGGGIEPGESPLQAAVREVEEEVGITIRAEEGTFMGTYSNELPGRTIMLNVFLFPDQAQLAGKGQWLKITAGELSSKYSGLIPAPNHRIIDDLYHSLYHTAHE